MRQTGPSVFCVCMCRQRPHRNTMIIVIFDIAEPLGIWLSAVIIARCCLALWLRCLSFGIVAHGVFWLRPSVAYPASELGMSRVCPGPRAALHCRQTAERALLGCLPAALLHVMYCGWVRLVGVALLPGSAGVVMLVNWVAPPLRFPGQEP